MMMVVECMLSMQSSIVTTKGHMRFIGNQASSNGALEICGNRKKESTISANFLHNSHRCYCIYNYVMHELHF